MKVWRVTVAILVLVGIVEFLLPLFTTKTRILVPLIQQNCGAVPLFLETTFDVEKTTTPRLLTGFLTCTISFLGILVLPGLIKVVHWLYRFVHPKEGKNRYRN